MDPTLSSVVTKDYKSKKLYFHIRKTHAPKTWQSPDSRMREAHPYFLNHRAYGPQT